MERLGRSPPGAGGRPRLAHSQGTPTKLEDLAKLDSIAMSAPDGRLLELDRPRSTTRSSGMHHATWQMTCSALNLPAVASWAFALPLHVPEEMRDRRLVRVLPDWAPQPAIVHASVRVSQGALACSAAVLDYLGETMPGRNSLDSRAGLQGVGGAGLEVLGSRAICNAPSFPCGRSFRRLFGCTMQPIEAVVETRQSATMRL